jgi:hypothetical protein
MGLIERAARALAKAQSGVDDWDALDEAFQANLVDHVRAVLRAIREPSESLKVAGSREGGWADWYDTDAGTEEQASNVWQAMIDAALVE